MPAVSWSEEQLSCLAQLLQEEGVQAVSVSGDKAGVPLGGGVDLPHI